MSESLKPYGFLQEDFHSEVLDYLFELITYREPKRKLVLYNEVDRYQNLDIYKKNPLLFKWILIFMSIYVLSQSIKSNFTIIATIIVATIEDVLLIS